MRRTFLLLVSLFVSVTAFAKSTTSDVTLLKTFEASLAELGRYRVEFDLLVKMNAGGDHAEQSCRGEYVVDKENFYVSNGHLELFVADGVKYMVNHSSREVVIESAAALGSDILSNPSRGFSALAEGYNAEPTEMNGHKALLLTSPKGGSSSESIIVVADESGRRPASIIYAMGADRIEIKIRSISTAESLPRYDESKFAGFEVIDWRQ